MMRGAPKTLVYFARRTDGEGPIKIGCTRSPEARLTSLCAWAPYPLSFVATIAGDPRVERQFHALFREQHSHCEWFHPSPTLERVIAQVAAGEFDLASLPPPRGLSSATRTGREGILAAVFSRRLARLQRAGVVIPSEVREARNAYGFPPEEVARRREIVREFVLRHDPRPVRMAA